MDTIAMLEAAILGWAFGMTVFAVSWAFLAHWAGNELDKQMPRRPVFIAMSLAFVAVAWAWAL